MHILPRILTKNSRFLDFLTFSLEKQFIEIIVILFAAYENIKQ